MQGERLENLQAYLQAEQAHLSQTIESLCTLDERLRKVEAASQEQASRETNRHEPSNSRLDLLESRIAALEANSRSAYQQATTSFDGEPSNRGMEKLEKDLGIEIGNEIGPGDSRNKSSRSLEPSSWEALLFVGLNLVRHSDSCLLVLGTILNIVLQGLFVVIAYEQFTKFPDNLGNDAVAAARKWRLTDAHSQLNMDAVSWTSLAARVCQKDLTLITSGNQVGVLEDIERYLKLAPVFPESFLIRTGPLLFCLVLAVWLTLIAGEIRQALEYVIAVLAVPRAGLTEIAELSDGSFQILAINTLRVYAVMIASLLRFVVAGMTGFIGAVWLAHTSYLRDLVLNAAAMAFIFDLDDLIYGSLAPLSVQVLVDKMQPFEISFRPVGFSQVGVWLRTFPYVVLVSVGLSMCFLVMHETDVMTGRMMQIRTELCERGALDFVVGMNVQEGLVLASSTYKVSSEVDASLNTQLRQATAELIELQAFEDADTFQAQEKRSGVVQKVPNPKPWSVVLVWSRPTFDRYSVSIPELYEGSSCMDMLDMLTPAHPAVVHMAVQSLNLSTQFKYNHAAKSCTDLISEIPDSCTPDSARDLRFLCSVTCGCAYSKSELLRSKDGCIQPCLAERWTSLQFLPCKDMPVTHLLQDPVPLGYINRWVNLNLCTDSLTDAFIEQGCELFTDMQQLRSMCGRYANVFIDRTCGLGTNFAPPDPLQLSMSSLRPWCPVSCGCIQQFSTDCPHGCAVCDGNASTCPSVDLDAPTCAGGLCRGSRLLPEKVQEFVAFPSYNITATCVRIHLEFQKVSESECAAMRSSEDFSRTREFCCEKVQSIGA